MAVNAYYVIGMCSILCNCFIVCITQHTMPGCICVGHGWSVCAPQAPVVWQGNLGQLCCGRHCGCLGLRQQAAAGDVTIPVMVWCSCWCVCQIACSFVAQHAACLPCVVCLAVHYRQYTTGSTLQAHHTTVAPCWLCCLCVRRVVGLMHPPVLPLLLNECALTCAEAVATTRMVVTVSRCWVKCGRSSAVCWVTAGVTGVPQCSS